MRPPPETTAKSKLCSGRETVVPGGKYCWGMEARSEKLCSREGTFSTPLLCLKVAKEGY